MENTKFDLSFDLIKIDYEALINVSRIAVGCLNNKIDERKFEVLDSLDSGKHTTAKLAANELKRITKDYAIAVEVYGCLLDGKKRSNKKLVNIPKIKDGE